MRKRRITGVVLLTATVIAGCNKTNSLELVERKDFINSLEEINSTHVYDSASLSSFTLKESFDSNWLVSDTESNDGSYCLQAVNGINHMAYVEISDSVSDVDEYVNEIIDEYVSTSFIYDAYTSTENYYAGRVNYFGNPGGDSYLVYNSGYSYVSECDFCTLLYRNTGTLLIFIADSESRFDAFVNEIDFPELHDFNSVFDFGQGNIYLDDGDEHVFSYIVFDDNDEATQYFEDRFYDNFVDICEDNDFDGYYSYKRSGERGDYSGYILLNGEFDDVQYDYSYDYLQEVYGGFYLKDNVVIAVYTRTNSQRRTDLIDQFLNEIGLPTPPKK